MVDAGSGASRKPGSAEEVGSTLTQLETETLSLQKGVSGRSSGEPTNGASQFSDSGSQVRKPQTGARSFSARVCL